MKNNRRKFLRHLAVGASAVSIGLSTSEVTATPNNSSRNSSLINMSGFKAPKMERLRIGLVGLGNRGSGALARLARISEVDIVAICDKDNSKVEKQNQRLTNWGLPKAKGYTGNEGWKAFCESDGIDLIYNCTPWSLHTPIAVYAMKNGKHTTTEVPAAKTVDECWQLVETSEKTKRHCMMLENTCYDFFEQMTLNMARQGLFGELVHAEGAYIHNLLDANFNKNSYTDMWRLNENLRNGNLYPTHGLGPIAQCMNINRGDKFDFMVSISTNDFQMAQKAKEKAADDPDFSKYLTKSFRGNMNTSIIKTALGKTIMVQHDVTSTRPYSRIHLISGTKGIAQKYPEPGRVAIGENWLSENELKKMEEKYATPLVKYIGEIAKSVGGHGGMDFMMDWRLVDCLRNGLPLDQDVYDAASWSVITPLSESSTAKKGKTMLIPDFTKGSWQKNTTVSLSLDGGGSTNVRKLG